MCQLVYETNLDQQLTEKTLRESGATQGTPLYTEKSILWFGLKDDDNIKGIQITPKGRVMIYCTSVEALNKSKSLPLIKSLTVNKDGGEAHWKLPKIVRSPADRLRDIKSRLQKIKLRWTITAYNQIVSKTGLSAELKVPELDYLSGQGMRLSDEDKKILQIEGNLALSEKLRRAAEEELMRTTWARSHVGKERLGSNTSDR
jgi:hypothetical protein